MSNGAPKAIRHATPRSKEFGRKAKKAEAKHLKSGARRDAIRTAIREN